ncbi:hypothetical protein [Streptomyces sp. YIM S03343]
MTTVHQILFGWAERDGEGNAGVRPVAHSAPPTLDRWTGSRLQNVWASRDGSGDAADATAALVHLVFDDEAAVLRKVPSRNLHGRSGATLTHALVGPRDAIDAQLALGLHDWTGWRESTPDSAPAPLGPLDLADLQDAARPGLDALRDRVQDIPRPQLTALVEHVLHDPAADFTVITRPELALPMMTALLDITGPVPGHPWTFTSHESNDVGGHQPRVVFLPARPPQSMYVNTRLRVEPAVAEPGTDPFPGQLADLYLESGNAALDRIRPHFALGAAEDVARWRLSVPVVDGRIADPRLRRDVLVDDDLLAAAAARGGLDSVRTELVGELRRQPADWLVQVLDRWGPDAQRGVRHPSLRDLVLHEAVEACLAESGPNELVEATLVAGPPRDMVATVFRRQIPYEGLDLRRKGHQRLLIVALHLGLDPDQLDREGLLAATPAAVLLEFFLAKYTADFPRAAYVLLRHHVGTRDGAAGAAEVWYGHDLLLAQVDTIADGDRDRELDCYRSLLTAAYGRRLRREDTAELLERAGTRAPLGLLAAALERAGDEGAERNVRYAIAERYLREEGYDLPARRTAPAGQGTAGGGAGQGWSPYPPRTPYGTTTPYPARAPYPGPQGQPPQPRTPPNASATADPTAHPQHERDRKRDRDPDDDRLSKIVVTTLICILAVIVLGGLVYIAAASLNP